MPSTDKKPATQVNPDSFTIMDHFRDAHIRTKLDKAREALKIEFHGCRSQAVMTCTGSGKRSGHPKGSCLKNRSIDAMASSLPIAMPPMVFSQFHQNNVNGYVTAPAKGKTVMVRSTDNLANTVPGELKE